MTWLEEYGTAVLDGRILACENIKTIYDRLLNDLACPAEYHFDEALANRHIEFIETFCRSPQGKKDTPIRLELFQKATLQAVFGFVDDNDIRRYNECMTVEGRKNGKTTEASAVAISLLMNDGERAPEVYTVATKLDQAKKCFAQAER